MWTTGCYRQVRGQWPEEGQHILALQDAADVVVYQAYSHPIADYALEQGHFGGPHFSYGRMSWIKPNFLWMMFRCGWATKQHQERVLALRLPVDFLVRILREAVYSSFQPLVYSSREEWNGQLRNSEVRLQWDPDHDPYGRPQPRRAVQLGLRGSILETYGREAIRSITDITPFVREQKAELDARGTEGLQVPAETVFRPYNEELCRKLGLSD